MGGLNNNVTGCRSQNWWWLLSHQSDTKAWGDDDIGSMSHITFFFTRMSHHLVETFDSMSYLWFGQHKFTNWVEQDLSHNRWCHQHCHLVVSWPSCLNYLLVEQAVVCSAAAIHKSEISSMDFNPNVKFQVGWDNTQYITKLYHHEDQSILDPRNILNLLSQ